MCRKTLQYFAEYGHRQQEELLQRQEQIQGLHDRLMENSKSILSAQVCYFLWTLGFLGAISLYTYVFLMNFFNQEFLIVLYRNLLKQSRLPCLLL